MDSKFEQIKMLNLTDDDFKLLVDGLDALPEKGSSGELMGDLLGAMLFKDDDSEKKAKREAEREVAKQKKEKSRQAMKEDIKILQGKLLMLKRYFQENNILKESYEILQIPNRD